MNYRRHLVIFCLLCLFCRSAFAQRSTFDFIPPSLNTLSSGSSIWGATNLIEIRQGSELSDLMNSYNRGGYETAYGEPVNFKRWYSPKNGWIDSKLIFMTQFSDNFGLLWGASTGEQGNKYSIAPSLRLGFVFRVPTYASDNFYIRATTVVGGNLREKSCIADYGEIGGIQEVNCRLAAGVDAPSETLKNLVNQKPYNQNVISVIYRILF
jgi:hypothetical protein